jgi:hydroxymethylpyrimidine pyrophosphatase-like HAD family hydrolase
MRPLAQSVSADSAGVDFVLTDMDDTLTRHGRLAARTYDALERLTQNGIKVIPVTAAPAGWCDQMVRMWPIDAVIGENGGIAMRRDGDRVVRTFWHDAASHTEVQARLADLRDKVLAEVPSTRVSDDQPFRLTSLAFERPSTPELSARILALLRAGGASATINSLWVLAWFGGYDKLTAARRFMANAYGVDIDIQRDRIVYVGDSTNDAPMFAHFPRSAGVSTVVEYLHEIDTPPAWITRGPGGDGFVEVADVLLQARK